VTTLLAADPMTPTSTSEVVLFWVFGVSVVAVIGALGMVVASKAV
jgi:hypothetical protein